MELEQKIIIGDAKIKAHYNAHENITKIQKVTKEEDEYEAENKEIFSGLKVLRIVTEKGRVMVDY